MNMPWGTHVSASDASPIGVGVCTRQLEGPRVAEMGRQAERWRYRCTSAVSARAHALGLDGPHVDMEFLEAVVLDSVKSSDPEDFDKDFLEIPGDVMRASAWATVISRRHWDPSTNPMGEGGNLEQGISQHWWERSKQ